MFADDRELLRVIKSKVDLLLQVCRVSHDIQQLGDKAANDVLVMKTDLPSRKGGLG